MTSADASCVLAPPAKCRRGAPRRQQSQISYMPTGPYKMLPSEQLDIPKRTPQCHHLRWENTRQARRKMFEEGARWLVAVMGESPRWLVTVVRESSSGLGAVVSEESARWQVTGFVREPAREADTAG